MKNPISSSTLFDTPTSMQDLHDWCMMHSGSERTIALVASGIAINLCSRIVDQAIEKQNNDSKERI